MGRLLKSSAQIQYETELRKRVAAEKKQEREEEMRLQAVMIAEELYLILRRMMDEKAKVE